MPPPRWPLSRRRPTQPSATSVSEPAPPPGPNGFWLTDPAFRDRLHSATLTTLDLIESVMYDGMTLTEALSGVREEVPHMLGVPAEYGLLVEAEAAAQIVEAAGLPVGSPFGPAISRGLARIEQQPIEDQEQFVRTAARRYALTTPSHPRSVPALPPTARTPGRAR